MAFPILGLFLTWTLLKLVLPYLNKKRMLPSLKDGALLSFILWVSQHHSVGMFRDGLVPLEVDVISQEAHWQSLHRDNTTFEDHPTP